MSENQDLRAERVARYKEERRRQLAAQFGQHTESPSRSKNGSSSNVLECPRPTRTSRLRMTAVPSEKCPTSAVIRSDVKPLGNRRLDKDKSNKRKSNLNRSLASEEVLPSGDDADEFKNRRRRRRFFPSEVLEQPSKISPGNKNINDGNVTTSSLSNNSLSPITASSPNSKLCSRKSELGMHMENARRGVLPAFSELGKYKPFTKHTVVPSSKLSSADKTLDSKQHDSKSIITEDNSRIIANRMEELSTLTKQTLARVERLANRNNESSLKRAEPSGVIKTERKLNIRNKKANSVESDLPSSILKKKNTEYNSSPSIELVNFVPCATSGPVSILKRKVTQDEHHRSDGTNSSNHTPPVTFSPSVVEPSTTKRKQGILKKRRSLDESTVLRHRSCSPDIVANKTDSRSILKNQRRSSLEELRRTQSPENQLQGILKRKTSKNEDDDLSLNSPQGILKRRSGASSAGSTSNTPHVSITTAVILAAAGGAEMILDSENERVKPILKKKSFSDDHSYHSDVSCDTPKPILKKKSSTETDDAEERPKPILKQHKSLEREFLDTGQDPLKPFKNISSNETDCEYKPILKQTNPRDDSPRLRLSFCAENNSFEQNIVKRRTSRRSNTICTDFNIISSNKIVADGDDKVVRKERPLSVQEIVMSFEKSCSTGAVPKRTSSKRNNDRYRTQPVTSGELEASLNLVNNPSKSEEYSKRNYVSHHSHSFDVHSLLDFTRASDGSNLSKFFSSSMHESTSQENIVCGKMSDSAFQSLGDGLELEQEDDISDNRPSSTSRLKGRFEPSNLEIQMKAIAEEAKKRKSEKGNIGIDRYRSNKSDTRDRYSTRFSTQPVTSEEVQEASRVVSNIEDDSEVSKFNNLLEHRSILKTNDTLVNRRPTSANTPKSVLKKPNIRDGSTGWQKPIIKLDTTSPDRDDEGISTNDSASESEDDNSSNNMAVLQRKCVKGGDSTSEGESSGGREIRSIFKNEKQLKLKNSLENILSKSRSQGIFGNDVTSGTDQKKTVSVRRSQTQCGMPKTIADLRAKLQESGESGWKKRVPLRNNATDELKLLKEKNVYNNELSEKSLLAAKKDELDASSKHWKVRVEKSDAEKFSVVGKMGNSINDSTLNIPGCENTKRIPQAKRFRLKDGSNSGPTSPEGNTIFDLTRSKSAPYSPVPDICGGVTSTRTARKVVVPELDDITFKTFFKSVEQSNKEHVELSLDDFDSIQRHSLLVLKKNVQVQKRRTATRNPIKALASRTDISNEYTEVITGVAERETKRLHIEKLSKNSNKALEALAGLASNEDFKSVALKKPSQQIALLPWKDLMLLQIKGRRHVQTRLVEPVASSINDGDCFVLITPTVLYNYIGTYSNVIEQSRTADLVNHIQKTGDMGCKTNKVVTIKDQETTSKYMTDFWSILGVEEPPSIISAGHPNEDETYEMNILQTNMIYILEGDELVPHEKCWGSIPKIEILEQSKIFVFDFGSEMYVWSGKNAPIDKKKVALKLAKEIWDDGYNYSECHVCPLNVASVLGARDHVSLDLKSNKRPDWAIFAKITQHRETILFREKFLDWPDFSRVIRMKSDDKGNKDVNMSFDIAPCDVDEMLQEKEKTPDLFIDNTHLGRGDKYFDEDTRRYFQYETLEIKAWRILENSHEELEQKSIGQFYDGNSYIYCWRFKQTVKGRELNGNPSRRAPVGRDRCIFFCWHGSNSSITEKCTAAFLTVELDKQCAPQVRISQGSEPAAFLNLFNGNMMVYNGKHGDIEAEEKPRLFILRGEVENEIYLMEVPLSMSSLRSRTSFIVINMALALITIWHGAKSSRHKKNIIRTTVDKLLKQKPNEMYLEKSDIDVVEVDEGEESNDFLDIFGSNRESYHSLLHCSESYNHTMQMYQFSSITGNFVATEILCPHRSEYATPYPFVQFEMYSASQPALYLIDNNHELWLWQGWWPEKEDEIEDLSDQIGSGIIRFHAERRAAMQTAVNYWKKKHGAEKPIEAYLVWAGMEPLRFVNLFPMWKEYNDVKELNQKEGKQNGEMLLLEKELSLLSRTTYPLVELLHRPLPEGVDPTHIEKYLSPDDFEDLLSLSKEDFDKLPSWKQTALKKEKGLF